MLDLTGWLASAAFPERPWVILGKGPTFDRRGDFDLGQFNRLGLNHAAAELAVDVAHVIDVDVVRDCGERLLATARWLVMPRYPHLRSAPSERRLEDWFDDVPALRAFEKEGRLVWYNLLGTRPEGQSPVIGVRFFSSEAALNILALLGARTVKTLGVDGGRSYAQAFAAVAGDTLLANGQPAFDVQFEQLRTIAAEHGIDVRPLVEPFRIFIGTDNSQIVAHRVLEYSIRKHASVPVEITPMLEVATPEPVKPENKPRVAFTFTRFVIPKLCGFQGRALYLDADMLVFGDIAELAEMPFDGNQVLCTSQAEPPAIWRGYPSFKPGRHTAVLLLDCSELEWDVDEIVGGLDEGRYSYEELVHQLCVVDRVGDTLPVEWNHLEHYEPGVTKLLHFTNVPTQPWKSDANPLGEVWLSWYREAVEAGAVPPEEVEALIWGQQVKESLAAPLRLAPNRRSTLTNASLDLAMARARIASLEAKLATARSSWSYRTEWLVRRALAKSRRILVKRAGAAAQRVRVTADR